MYAENGKPVKIHLNFEFILIKCILIQIHHLEDMGQYSILFGSVETKNFQLFFNTLIQTFQY